MKVSQLLEAAEPKYYVVLKVGVDYTGSNGNDRQGFVNVFYTCKDKEEADKFAKKAESMSFESDDDQLAHWSQNAFGEYPNSGYVDSVKVVTKEPKQAQRTFAAGPAKLNEQLAEGAYVVKNRDGVEKRFKDPDGVQALAWKESGKKAEKADAKATSAAVAKNDLDVVWDAISRIADWQALDWIDLVKMQAVPYLVKAIAKKPNDYSMDLRRAVALAARTNGQDEFDPLLKYFDKATKAAGNGGWKSYARSMASYRG